MMADLLAVALLIGAFAVLTATFFIIARLHRARFPRLPSMEKGKPGEPFRLRFNWPIVDWLIKKEENFLAALPGYYYPIGAVYGIIAAVVACLLIFLAYGVASILGLLTGFLATAYSLEGVSQALKRRDLLRAAVAALGLVLGYSIMALHMAALFGRRLLPAWSL